MKPAPAGHYTKPVGDRTAPSRVPAPESFALVQKSDATPSASAKKGSDMLSLENDPISPSLQEVS